MSELIRWQDKDLSEYYNADDVGAVIAEKDKIIDDLKHKFAEERSAKVDYKISVRDLSNGLRKAITETRHQKYKRCLAMAKWCDAKADWYYSIGESFRNRVEFYMKWHKRWLELAKKFKEK